MAKYMLPVRVNSRKYTVLHFYDTDEMALANEQHFVCSIPQAGTLYLAEFLHPVRATSDISTRDDRTVAVSGMEKTGDDTYTVHLEAVGEGSEGHLPPCTPAACGVLSLSDSYDNRYTSIKVDSLSEHTVVYMTVLFELDGKRWSSSLAFDLVPYEDTYRVVLDFGSEASQGICLPCNQNFNSAVLPFISLAKKYVRPEYSHLEDREFHQYEPDKETRSSLFRSLFYADDHGPLFLSLLSQDNELRMSRKQLPNIKLGLLDKGPANILIYYSNIVLRFIECACKYILELRRNSRIDNNRPLGLQIELLVPNIMSMEVTRSLIRQLQDDFNFLRDDSDMELFCLEINAFSESDASFLGYFYNHRLENRLYAEQSYLLIDAGKGTMDFSVIGVEDGNRFNSIYRDGFIGSGNAITYAFFDYICALIVGFEHTEDRRQLMHNLLFSKMTDQLGLLNLLRNLESVKAAEPNPALAAENCRNLQAAFSSKWKDLQLEVLNEYLSNHTGDYGDIYGIIHGTCDKICNYLVQHLITNRIVSTGMPQAIRPDGEVTGRFDEVILAGRAFRYKPFKDTLIFYMDKYFKIPAEKIRYESDRAKASCLYGLLHYQLLNCNCGLSGIPTIGKAVLKKQPEPEPVSETSLPLEIDFLMKRFISDDLRYEPEQNEPVRQFSIDENFLNQGIQISLSNTDILRMNGHEMEKENIFFGNEYNLYFEGSRLMLRDQGNVSLLKRSLSQASLANSLILESRFPNYSAETDSGKLPIKIFPTIQNNEDEEA